MVAPSEFRTKMKIQTMSIVAGTEACNARCPFCVAGMTPAHELGAKPTPINLRNFRKACTLARMAGVTTVLITGKGEPTLFPQQISAYLEAIEAYEFPFIELQTNGLRLAEAGEGQAANGITDELLADWHQKGLTTIMLSVVGTEPELNRQVYVPYRQAYLDLPGLVARLKRLGFVIRLCVVGIKEGVDSVDKLQELLAFARQHRVDQVTWRPAKATDSGTKDASINQWIHEHSLTDAQWQAIAQWADDHGQLLMKLAHGSQVYDVAGQNLCMSSCLTLDPSEPELRQIIFWPNGRLTYDWQYQGAILL
jgi:wyosine [tRNA(Phe)-imidazoG37] synthetase (radical SAM superfamily)